jgi:hypothetical protein
MINSKQDLLAPPAIRSSSSFPKLDVSMTTTVGTALFLPNYVHTQLVFRGAYMLAIY